MRTSPTDPALAHHDGLVVLPDQHHPPAETVKVTINGTTIATGSSLQTFALTYAGHKVARAILRGPLSLGIVGNAGAYAVGTDASGQAAGFSMVPGGYTITSYIGGYSRMHGDTYVSERVFGTDIVLKDVRINGSNLELEFWNLAAANRTLSCWGLVVIK
jgi:hypothetical protein